MYLQHEMYSFTSRSVAEPETPVPLLARGSMAAMRARFQLDVVLEHVHISHHVQLTDKELRITFQRDAKHINSDPAIWKNNMAEFRQVVGLQSTLTRADRSSTSSATTFEPKLYHFIVTSLPSQTQVAHFELDIALYLNKSLTLSLPALPSSKDPSARLSLNIKCHIVDRNNNPTKKHRADTATAADLRGSTRLVRDPFMDGPLRHSKAPPSLVRSSTLTDSSSTMNHGGIQDTFSEYSDDGHASIDRLTRQLEGQQRKVKKLQASLTLAEKKMDGLQFELDELQVREDGETQHGLQLRTWNLTLLQEFEILKLQLVQDAIATTGSLEPAYDHIQKIHELTRAAYVFEPETTIDEIRNDSLEDDDDDDASEFGKHSLSSSHREIDSNFNFDPEVEWSGGSPKNDDSIVLEDMSFTTLAHDPPPFAPCVLAEDGNHVLIDELRNILKRNQRLQQTTEFLLVALQPAGSTTDEPLLDPIPVAVPAHPKELDPLGLALERDLDLNARLKQLQDENATLRADLEQLQAQVQLQQGLGRLNAVIAEKNDLAAKVKSLEAALASAPSTDAFQKLETNLVSALTTVRSFHPTLFLKLRQVATLEKRLQELERRPPPTTTPTAATASHHVPASPVRSEMAVESMKHMQTLKQENLAMKFRLTTLEPLQEKYEIAEKERKRLSLRLQQFVADDSADAVGPRSRQNTMDKTHDDVRPDALTRQRMAGMDMQINVLNELHRTQTMQIQHMEEDYAKVRADFVAHMKEMQDAMAALADEHALLQTPEGRRAALALA
ncbi:hypothetical protein SPRG_09099 [Saprolegnia parasitica CBS 223.65]|uniref:C2 NT-type domain-containing protein n=1 Tax=Saprolegnia parasitica (strain CBS 223.65) TaxID=695850 RepID=A0A067C7Z6_SAPPC|nr:hypothetical protein SPRG_09099 [Saprolegnia parasitica CBS 223.65]KDO25270.1 hypothetical protein SPRG_09099 [Saprolegnia parasitica CBS 223.65]|eukprot:XP_012203930.1 hypothetical protein SPRG_09099 [Saprolegnia parasitica CBS 223.65]